MIQTVRPSVLLEVLIHRDELATQGFARLGMLIRLFIIGIFAMPCSDYPQPVDQIPFCNRRSRFEDSPWLTWHPSVLVKSGFTPAHIDVIAHLYEPLKMLRSHEKYGSFESEIAAHYFVSALMGILVWWVEKDLPCSAAEIDSIFRQLAMPGFRHVLAVNHET